MKVAKSIALSLFLLATLACQTKQESKGPKLRQNRNMIVLDKNRSWETEDAIDLADARCSEYGGSWNGEDWDRNDQACYRALR